MLNSFHFKVSIMEDTKKNHLTLGFGIGENHCGFFSVLPFEINILGLKPGFFFFFKSCDFYKLYLMCIFNIP